jgi:hypothetical protein
MNNLFLSRRGHTMNVNGAVLDNIKAAGWVSFAKKVFAFVKRLDHGNGRDLLQVTPA